ncbi:NifB/NifX family molybdenum-iron cluster-binding protein [Fundidesulfovibrio butyratiphilus]
MRDKRVLIPLCKDEVAPRFDLAGQALLAVVDDEDGPVKTEEFLLPHPSADGLCDLVLLRGVDVVICGGIEEEYYHYLRWKRVEVIDNVAAKARQALDRFQRGTLKAGDILLTREQGHAG